MKNVGLALLVAIALGAGLLYLQRDASPARPPVTGAVNAPDAAKVDPAPYLSAFPLTPLAAPPIQGASPAARALENALGPYRKGDYAAAASALDGVRLDHPGSDVDAMRLKPYILDGATRNVGATEFDNDFKAGLDFKAGVTPSMALDLTINPDFAQAEADEQQVNLTQFSLFYPEKREFFLENSGIFYVGDIPRNQRQVARFRPPEEDLLLFFSRRIGLTDAGEQVPLYGGARLTGRAGAYGLGFMGLLLSKRKVCQE